MPITPQELVDLNKRVLTETAFEGDRPHGVQNMPGLKRALSVAPRHFPSDAHKRATLLCCAIIANHPFNDGNHRTSLEAALFLLLTDGWFYHGNEDDEKIIYNWRFDYEEAHDLEREWSLHFGGFDSPPNDEYLLGLVNSEYGRTIEQFLRTHTTKMDLESLLLALPPDLYCTVMRAYPAGAWKKSLNRKRRAHASVWNRSIWPAMAEAIYRQEEKEAQIRARRKPQKHWRPEKL